MPSVSFTPTILVSQHLVIDSVNGKPRVDNTSLTPESKLLHAKAERAELPYL